MNARDQVLSRVLWIYFFVNSCFYFFSYIKLVRALLPLPYTYKPVSRDFPYKIECSSSSP